MLLWGNMSEAVLISTPIALIILVMYAVIYWVRPSRETNWWNLIVCARYEDALLFFFTDTPPKEDITELIIDKLDLDSYRGSFAG